MNLPLVLGCSHGFRIGHKVKVSQSELMTEIWWCYLYELAKLVQVSCFLFFFQRLWHRIKQILRKTELWNKERHSVLMISCKSQDPTILKPDSDLTFLIICVNNFIYVINLFWDWCLSFPTKIPFFCYFRNFPPFHSFLSFFIFLPFPFHLFFFFCP